MDVDDTLVDLVLDEEASFFVYSSDLDMLGIVKEVQGLSQSRNWKTPLSSLKRLKLGKIMRLTAHNMARTEIHAVIYCRK